MCVRKFENFHGLTQSTSIQIRQGGTPLRAPGCSWNICEIGGNSGIQLKERYHDLNMAPNLSEDEIDDLVYLARTGDDAELTGMLQGLVTRENATPAEILAAAKDDGKATCLHMAAANGHASKSTAHVGGLVVMIHWGHFTLSPICHYILYQSTTFTYFNAETVTLLLSHFPPPLKTSRGGATGDTPEPTEDTPSQGTTAETPYINVQNAFGNTALHWACLGGHLDVVKLLLSRGASPTAANDKDQIPLDLAAFNNHMHVVNYFLSQSKDIEGDNAKEGGLEKSTQDVQMEDAASEETGTKAEAGG